MREGLKEAHRDQSGAVMMTGLGMACFLIGALWFIIGVGDAIVFRDTMQETADHAAFTSAVLHAKGMNFISACNLIMLALFAIHIIMGIIHDILLAICIAGAVFTFGASCSPWRIGWSETRSARTEPSSYRPTATVAEAVSNASSTCPRLPTAAAGGAARTGRSAR